MGKASTRRRPPQVTLDTGALLAIDRGDRRMLALVDEVVARGGRFWIPSGALARALCAGLGSAVSRRFVAGTEAFVVPLDEALSRACGELMAAAGTQDLVQASVVIVARKHGNAIVTSDGAGLGRLDPRADIVPL